MTQGKFIVVEGIEGVGKSTNLAFISSLLSDAGIEHLITREPGGTPMAENIRNLLLDHGEEPVTAATEVLLFFAARSQHVQNLIGPTLAEGKWVLCDRFTDSSLAYQGGGRGIDMALLHRLEDFVQLRLRPDKVLILDMPVDVALGRVARRGDADRLDGESVAFFERAREVFLQRAAEYPEHYAVIDANQELEKVQTAIRLVLMEMV